MQLPHEKVELLIPDLTKKLFYKIGEVSRITQLEPYVLRYWEKEFQFLAPRKGASGQRVYQKKDIEIILEIRRLLYNERFTIEGVRKKLFRNYISFVDANTPEAKTDTKIKSKDKKETTQKNSPKQKVKKVIDKNIKETLKTIKAALKDLHKTLVISKVPE
ncbi:MAG: MerR family transcriptional regulator [Nitrospirae bacterium]|nr:MerR family transcriptional regulator [Nitrospirota bacterium]MBF0540794.1 MerR family transcriptional regulator [Nitrospirota bacterium]